MKLYYQQGFTLIELMVVVIILGVIAAVAIPNMASINGKNLDNAANEIALALRFAQAESIRTKIPYGIIADAATERIRVYRLPALSPVYDVYHPVDKKLYDLQLKTDATIGGVDLVNASFVFGAYTSTTTLEFSVDGIPKYTSAGADAMLTSGAMTLGLQEQQRVITVAPMTGRVTIQ